MSVSYTHLDVYKRQVLMSAGPLVLLLAGGAYWLSGGRYVATENAYLHQALSLIHI